MNRNFVEWMNHFFDEKLGLGDNIMQVLQRHRDEDVIRVSCSHSTWIKGRPQHVSCVEEYSNETTWCKPC
jgi:hypothetical protein